MLSTVDSHFCSKLCCWFWIGLWVRKFPEISGKITVLFRNNSAKNFREVFGRKFHEMLMQLQHSNALFAFMRWCLLTKFTCLLTLCTLSRQTHCAVAGKQTSSVNDVIHYECMIDRTLHVRKISGIFPEKFRKVSDILFFRKTYNPKSTPSRKCTQYPWNNERLTDNMELWELQTPVT